MSGRISFQLFIIISLFICLLSGWPNSAYPPPVSAAVTVTTATGGSAISADSTGGSFTTLTGPTIAEAANRDIGTGTIILNVPTGFIFNTSQAVTATVNKISGNKACLTLSSGTATPTTTTITFTVSAQDGSGSTICEIVFSNIQVRPSAGTPLASGNLTRSGSASILGLTTSTNLGTLTEVVGAKNRLEITTAPSSTATANVDFAVKPVVKVEDQFGNVRTADNSSTVNISAVLSTQACGGTAGSGTITATPTSGSTVTAGVLTYTAMQYSVGEDIKLCFSSSGATSVLSGTVSVAGLIYSVAISPAGVITYGSVEVGQSRSTIDISQTKTLTNDGNTTEDLNIKSGYAVNGTSWTLGTEPGNNVFVHEFSTTGGTSWTPFTVGDAYLPLASDISQSGTVDLDLRITAPTGSDDVEKSITVTIQAVFPQ